MSNILDKTIAYFFPKIGLKRAEYRARNSMAAASMQQLFPEPSGYLTAGMQKRSLRGWRASAISPDADILPKIQSARASSRDLFMNTPLANAAIKRIDTNVIGHGLTLQSRIGRAALGLNDKEADAWERNTEMLFRIFADSKNCDISRAQNFYQLQSLAFVSPLLSGDVFFSLPWKPVKGWPYELRIKLIESDLCSNPDMSLDTEDTAGGIKIDSDGAPLSYFFANKFSAGEDIFSMTPREWKEVPAFDEETGRQNIYHIFDKTRPGQRRGIAFLAPVFEVLKQTSRLTEAKLMQNLIQTFFTVFIKDSKGPVSLQPNFGPQTSVLSDDEPDIENQYELGNANIVELDDSKDITIADPHRTDVGFQSFFESMVKQISASCEVPFEQLLLHFSASYSASRAALLEAWKFYRKRRATFALEFNQPVYEAWLYEMVYKGVIKAPGFLEDPILRKMWCKTQWGGSGQGQIDPLKETDAAIKKINYNLSNYEDEHTAIYGGDWESSFDRKVREDSLIKENGQQPLVTSRSGKIELGTTPPTSTQEED